MKKINKHIEIVSSTIKSLSSMTEESRLAIQKSLSKTYQKVGITIVNNESDLDDLIAMSPDLVFLGMSYIPRTPTASQSSPCIWLAEALNKAGILYTGSPYEAMMLENDKLKAKKVIKKAGLSTAPFFMAYTGQFTSESQLPLSFPMFIKPPKFSTCLGIDDKSVVRDYRQYKSKIAALDKEFDSEALVETFLTGKEFTVAILKNEHNDDYQTMPLEIKTKENSNGDVFFDYKTKASGIETAELITDPEIKEEVTMLALNCFNELGAKDYGRIDIRYDSEGTPYFLEANLIPGLIVETSYFQIACQLHAKMSYDDMLSRMVELGFKNHIPYVAPVASEVALAK